MWKTRFGALLILIIGAGIGYFIYASEPKLHGEKQVAYQTERFPFKLGLDLSGGVELVYKADTTSVKPSEINDAMDALRDVVERRINLFGVSEPIVQVETKGGVAGPEERRLIVELPGVTDVKKAVEMIGQTPKLEFMKERSAAEMEAYRKAVEDFEKGKAEGKLNVTPELLAGPYEPTELNGRFLERAVLQFDPTTREPVVSLVFNKEGAKIFGDLTQANIGKTIAIYLDRDLGNMEPISAPVVREAILGGEAQISGKFTADEARLLVGRLNSGALPVDKLELLSTQTISAPLGAQALAAGVWAGIWGLVLVAIFLVLWYRLPGLVAVVALSIYIVIMLALFKFLGVALTAAGIAGFILSIGMAVDANILIFERTKEELRKGHAVHDAIREGFARAWTSIRDSNTSSIITAIILFWFGTSLIKGFALTFGLGVIVSMFSAITVSRVLLYSLPFKGHGSVVRALFGSGFFKLH